MRIKQVVDIPSDREQEALNALEGLSARQIVPGQQGAPIQEEVSRKQPKGNGTAALSRQ